MSKSCRRRSRDISTVSRLGFPFPQVPLLIPISWNVILLLFFLFFSRVQEMRTSCLLSQQALAYLRAFLSPSRSPLLSLCAFSCLSVCEFEGQ